MKHAMLLRILPCLIVACTPLFSHCGGETDSVTETGNPPAIRTQKLHVVLRGTGVEVVGEPGAVSPGALVSVTNLATGARAEGRALADGSIALAVPGSLQDEYDVTVTSGGTSQTVRINAEPASASAAGNATDLVNASCAGLESTLGRLVESGFAAGGTACESDVDCAFTSWDVGCYAQCGGTYLTSSAVSAVRSSVERAIEPVCAELESRCASLPVAACTPTPGPFDAECFEGACRGLDRALLSCDELAQKVSTKAASDRVSRDCSSDGDCGVVRLAVSCQDACGAWLGVARTSVESVVAAVQRAESFCPEFNSKACPRMMPVPCPPAPLEITGVHCQAGTCEITP